MPSTSENPQIPPPANKNNVINPSGVWDSKLEDALHAFEYAMDHSGGPQDSNFWIARGAIHLIHALMYMDERK